MIGNVLIGGSAGQGMDTLAAIFERLLKDNGLEILTIRDYMSRVRGGHNFIVVRYSDEFVHSHDGKLDAIIALNQETVELHLNELKPDGFIVCDKEVNCEDKRVLRLPLKDIAKENGNAKFFGNVAFGVMLKKIGLCDDKLSNALERNLKQDVLESTKVGILKGMELVQSDAKPISGDVQKKKLMINGNEAIGLGAIAAGCKFYSAYPMTPSTSIMNYISTKMEEAKIVVEQAEDEIAAINMAIGASNAGVRSMTGTSGGGYALMVEAMGLSGMMEVPIVVAEIQRPGPTTGLPTRTEQGDLRFVVSSALGDYPRMVIAPRNPEDAFHQTVRAFNLADKYQIPVIILGDQYLADTTRTIDPFDLSKVTIEKHLACESELNEGEYKRYKLTDNNISPRIYPGQIPGKTFTVDSDEHDEFGKITESADVRVKMQNKRLNKIELLKGDIQEPEFIGSSDPDTLIVAWGSLEGAIIDAVDRLNKSENNKYAALIFGDVWPLPTKLLEEYAEKVKTIINVEQNSTGNLASLIREVTGIAMSSSILKYDGRQISASEIVEKIKEVK